MKTDSIFSSLNFKIFEKWSYITLILFYEFEKSFLEMNLK